MHTTLLEYVTNANVSQMSRRDQGRQWHPYPYHGPRLMGNWYYGSIPFREETTQILNRGNWLLQKMGRSRASDDDNREQSHKLCLEKHHLQVWSPMCHNIRQWKTVWQPQVSKILPRLRSKKPLLFPKTPSGQHPNRSDEQKLAQNYQN